MKKNGKKNETKTSKKLFKKGGPGGPGRKKESDGLDITAVDFWEASEKAILKDMKSKNDTTRTRAIGLYMKWKAMRDEYEKRTNSAVPDCIHPDVIALLRIGNVLRDMNTMDLPELAERVCEVCPKCDRLGGSPIDIEVPEP